MGIAVQSVALGTHGRLTARTPDITVVTYRYSVSIHQVVFLMMDVKRLALRREALVALKQKKSHRNASTDLDGTPEKIKLRSR